MKITCSSILILLCLLLTAPKGISSVGTSSSRRTVIITGANSGIGFQGVKQLAETGNWNVIMACRNKILAEKALSRISKGRENCEVQLLDLASLDDVRRFCTEWKKQKRPLHVLAANAGIQMQSGNKAAPPVFTSDGFEATVGTNHIGHFLLIQSLISELEKSKGSRIVIVGSGVHNPEEGGGNVGSKATLGDLSGFASGFKTPVCMVDSSPYDADKAYKDSKLCNVITALEGSRRLARKGYKTTCNVMNPGLIPTTGLFRALNPLFVTVFSFLTRFVFRVAATEEEGGKRLATMVASPKLDGKTGQYFSGSPGNE